MPGSRIQEVRGLLPCMLEAAKLIRQEAGDVQFILPRASTIDEALLDELIQSSGMDVTIGEDRVYDMMNLSTAAIAASGTATLETALMGLPTLLVYRVNRLTYWLSKVLVHIDSIGLPNIIMGHRVIPELWQDEVTPENIAAAMVPMITDKAHREALHESLAAVRRTMGEPGAVQRTAQAILDLQEKEVPMKQYNSWQSYKRLLMFIKPYKMRLAVAVICMALSGASNVVVPWLIKDVIDKVLANKDIYTLNLIVIGILVLFLLRGFFYFGQKYLMSFVGQKIVNDIRETLYRHLQTLSLSYFDKHKTGNIMSNLTNDVTALQTAIAGNLISFVQEAVILIGSLGSMLFLYWKLTLLTLVIVPLVVFTINFSVPVCVGPVTTSRARWPTLRRSWKKPFPGSASSAPSIAKTLKSAASWSRTTAISGLS